METPSSKRKKNLQKLLQTQPEKPIIDSESSAEEENVEELSDIESEEDACADSVEDLLEQLMAESEEEEAAHTSTRETESLASFTSVNRIKWYFMPPTEKEQTAEADKVSNYEPDVRYDAKNKNTPINVWSLLFTDDMLNIIVKHTNAEIARKRENSANVASHTSPIDLEELKALIGLLYYSGLHRENNSNVTKLWESSHASPNIYRATMAKNRFIFLLACLQFDDKSTRKERHQRDNLAKIRDFWHLFISNCTKYYSPSKHVTIGEQLLNFRGKCPFLVNSHSTGKYGLNIVMMNDLATSYMINAIPYFGKVDTTSVPSYYVRELSEPIHNSHRNITCNKRFTSVPLVQSMKNDFSLSMVGTIKAREREIPTKMKRFTTVNALRLLYTNDLTLASYCAKQNKIVLVLSSLPKRERVVNGKKVNIIQFYDSTKGGTDTFDQMCCEYSTVRSSTRNLHWPMRLFYAMLDQGGYNSFMLYSLNKKNKQMSREEFLKTLYKSLITPFIKRRLESLPKISIELRMLMKRALLREKIANHNTHMIRLLTN